MPADMQRLMKNKEAIIDTIARRGPSLPVQIARQTNLTLLFASAYLSELYNERKLKMSHMKVGSSPLYYIEGQESQLDNFVQYLNHKEREAYTRLKNEKLLEDDKLEPAIRVALRAIKDFAVPVRIKIIEESKLFWKYYLISDLELKDIAQEMLFPKRKKEEKKEEVKEKAEEILDKQEKLNNDKEKVLELKEEKKEEVKEKAEEISETEVQKKEVKDKKKIIESKFTKEVKEYLLKKEIETLNILEEKKNILTARVRVDTIFGKQEYYMVAKDKKKINEEDIMISLQKAQEEKMLALILSPGEIDKKSLDYAKSYRNLVKFENLKL